ncbi:hypothetical protein WKK05_35075 [Nostoc sp. UHCC 0302]|uniref:hypothetical protein n=1 Tax=Nostoc sp. UHCC 0302 TaxID=3134896 RepID=UPI00311CC64F
MAKHKSSNNQEDQTLYSSTEALEASQAKEAGSKFEWHTGRITRLGNFEIAGGRQVTIIWDEGGVMSQQEEITDEQWEIFKLAFMTTGRLAILSDQEGEKWMRDYRFLEVMR